jgi:predicted acylesterase/phospholipase RssA
MFKRLCLLVLLAISPFASAQELRTGLVLSGGGARGLAHIGVLKELEARNIPIHAIAGTSMGAVIGGLYAAGYSAAELEKIALELDHTRGRPIARGHSVSSQTGRPRLFGQTTAELRPRQAQLAAGTAAGSESGAGTRDPSSPHQ